MIDLCAVSFKVGAFPRATDQIQLSKGSIVQECKQDAHLPQREVRVTQGESSVLRVAAL